MPFQGIMPREGYTNLSIESKRYDKNRRNFDTLIKKDVTYSAWAMDVLDDAIEREKLLTELFPKMHFVGKKKNGGIVIEDNRGLIDIEIKNGKLECSAHDNICEHLVFAAMHPMFV